MNLVNIEFENDHEGNEVKNVSEKHQWFTHYEDMACARLVSEVDDTWISRIRKDIIELQNALYHEKY